MTYRFITKEIYQRQFVALVTIDTLLATRTRKKRGKKQRKKKGRKKEGEKETGRRILKSRRAAVIVQLCEDIMERGLITDLFPVRFEQCSSSRVLYQRVWNYIISRLSWREQIFCRATPGEISFQIRSDYVSYGKQTCFVYTMELFQRFTLFYYGDTCICEQKREKYFSELSRWNELRVILISLTLKMLACCYTICTYNTYNVTRGDWLSLNWVITLSNCIWTGVSHCI